MASILHPIADALFECVLSELKNAEFTPFSLTVSNGDVLEIALCRETLPTFSNLVNEIHETHGGGLHCNTCKHFMKKNGQLQFEEGMMFDFASGPYVDLGSKTTKIKSVKIFTEKVIGTPFSDGFDHFHATLNKVSEFKNSFDAKDYEWYLRHNVPTLLRTLSEHNEDGIIESLELLIETLDSVTYGDKLIHAMRWFLCTMEEYRAIPRDAPDHVKHLMVSRALLNARLTPGVGHERIICTNLGQAKNNGLDALACANDVNGLNKLLTSRFSPLTYCRPTADPTEGQYKEAMKLFKDLGFTTPKVMPLANIEKYGGVLVANSANGANGANGADATTIWNASLSKKQEKASGFAARSGEKNGNFPKTFDELITRAEKFPGLQVMTTGETPVFLTEIAESSKIAFKYPHLWAFESRQTVKKYGIVDPWCSVNAVTKMGRNVFIGLCGAHPTLVADVGTMSNTCFPSFLETAYERRCRTAFEELNKTKLTVIGSEPLAIGIGTSRKDEGRKAVSSMRFRFQGTEFTIDMF
jgi:hypothetical protein